MVKRLLIMFTTACLLFGLLPMAAGAAGEAVQIKLTIGSPTLSVNGVNSVIQKPYQSNGTTMVPLSVITKAFGAALKLENNKIITLTYNSTSVVLTIGSKTVKVNGTPATLTAEPKIVNSVTMVPLRVTVSAFGASIDVAGKQITINGAKASSPGGNSANTGGINPDSGKTKVGDSYYGWSMNYPSELSMSYQSDNGGWTEWSDGSGAANIIVSVEDIDQEYTREELRDHILSFFADDEFVVEKKTVTVGNASLEKIISRDRKGWYFEYRGMQKDNRIYVVMAGAKSESRDGLKKYQTLLDSFSLTFEKADRSLKDITKVKDGYMTVTDKEYGLSVQLPVDWIRDKEAPQPTFMNENDYMDFSVSSLDKGDTAEQWMKRSRKNVEDNFVSDYLRNISESSINLQDGTAQVLTFEYSWTKDEWYREHDVFFVSGSHKYLVSFFYPLNDSSDGEALFNRIVSTLDIDTAYVDQNFSEIEDQAELENMTVTKTSKKYGYSIELPQSWSGVDKDFEKDSIIYSFAIGAFGLHIYSDLTPFEFVESYKNYASQDDDMKAAEAQVKEIVQTTINGMNVFKITADVPKADKPYTILQYVFEKNGKVYVLAAYLNKANDTEMNRNRIETTIQSFKFSN